MTKREAVKGLDRLKTVIRKESNMQIALNMAIEALDQEETLQNLKKPNKSDLIVKGAGEIKDGLYNIKDGKLFKYKANGGTVRTYPIVSADRPKWIPCSERMPEEREWAGTEKFGTTISDMVLVTFEAQGERFVKPMRFQNGELGGMDKRTMDAICDEWKTVAWMPLPEAYREDGEEE